MPGVLVFDGDCGFCTSSAARLERWASGALVVVPWQHADLAELGLTPAQCAAAVQFTSGGVTSSGGAGVAQALQRCRQPWRTVGRVIALPWLAPAVESCYALVAANRHRLPGSTDACALHGDEGRLRDIDRERPRQPVAPPHG